MIRIAISAEAFEAITATLALGTMSFENATKGYTGNWVTV